MKKGVWLEVKRGGSSFRIARMAAGLLNCPVLLKLAGSTYVLQFMKLLGQSLSRSVLRTSTRSNIIGNIDALLIAEAPAMRTPLVGISLQQTKLRETTGITVVGVWERGRFEMPTAATHINSTTVLLLAGSAEQLKNYDEHIGGHQKLRAPILILGGGRVGLAAAEALEQAGIDYRIIEKNKKLAVNPKYIYGWALPNYLLPEVETRHPDHLQGQP